jgi:hypothetical protein
VLCGRVLEEDEGPFEADLMMCPGCDYKILQDKHPIVNEWKSKRQSSLSAVLDAGGAKTVRDEAKGQKKKWV